MAISLMGALMVSLYTGFRIAFGSRERAEGALEPARIAALAMELIRTDLESAMPPTGVLAGAFVSKTLPGTSGSAIVDVYGESEPDLSFFSCANFPDGTDSAGEVRHVAYVFAGGEGGVPGELVRRITVNLLAPEVPAPAEEVLCRNVLSFTLRYYDGTTWQDTWSSSQQGNALPEAVEVTLALAENGPAQTAAGEFEAPGYTLTRVFRLPCAPPPSGNQLNLSQGPA